MIKKTPTDIPRGSLPSDTRCCQGDNASRIDHWKINTGRHDERVRWVVEKAVSLWALWNPWGTQRDLCSKCSDTQICGSADWPTVKIETSSLRECLHKQLCRRRERCSLSSTLESYSCSTCQSEVLPCHSGCTRTPQSNPMGQHSS